MAPTEQFALLLDELDTRLLEADELDEDVSTELLELDLDEDDDDVATLLDE